ncbi:MAG: acetate--CoA ligase family protein [Betaproteobacteria bacterium]|nr:MAG: acetate--CoA ligase family protein [Betaproteobacteria bacterium]
MSSSPRETLRAALDPKSVAIVGASDNPNKIGGRPLLYLGRYGYQGKIYPINPNRSQVQRHQAYPDLLSLPDAPEVVIIAVPGDGAVDAVEKCAAMGVKVAVVMSSGFGEVDATEGKAKEARMRVVARSTGMRVVGPNSQGLANFGTGAVLSFSTMYIEMPAEDGPVAIVSQSGAMSVVPYALLRSRGIGVRHSHATGNECDATVGELASVVAEDSDVKLLLLYVESISDARALATLAGVARDRDLPVIALKSGRTAAGQEAARSHTGALANEDRVVEAFLEQQGIWRARNMAELVASAELYLKGWKPRGGRLVAISNSGAACVMAADTATQAGLSMAKLSGDTRGKLEEVLPSFATATNPIDLTAALLTNSGLFSDILPIVAADPGADAVVISIPVAGEGYDVEAFARDTANFANETGLPLVVSAPQATIADAFRDKGLTVFPTESEAVETLAQYLSHTKLMCESGGAGAIPEPRNYGEGVMLNESDALDLLRRYGFPVVEHRLCRTEHDVAAAFDALGQPLVIKACSRDVVHKSELGLVRLGIQDVDAALQLFRDVGETLDRQGLANDGVIVARMSRGRRELMLGGKLDPIFGPVVIVGDGGKFVEAMPDARVLIWPFREEDVLNVLARLRIAPLLAGVRDEPPLDAAAVGSAAVKLGALLADASAGVINVDINPLSLGARGEGCRALDAVVYLEG